MVSCTAGASVFVVMVRLGDVMGDVPNSLLISRANILDQKSNTTDIRMANVIGKTCGGRIVAHDADVR